MFIAPFTSAWHSPIQQSSVVHLNVGYFGRYPTSPHVWHSFDVLRGFPVLTGIPFSTLSSVARPQRRLQTPAAPTTAYDRDRHPRRRPRRQRDRSVPAWRAHAASETFAAWVPEEDDADATEYYDAAAQLTADHYEQVLEKIDDHDPADVPAIQTQLRDADDTAARLGGLLGHTLVAGKLVEQFTGFFVGDADPQTASLFRGYGGDVEDLREDVLDLIDDLDADDDAVAAAATDAIQAAYESYTDRLEDMGVNPKPVC